MKKELKQLCFCLLLLCLLPKTKAQNNTCNFRWSNPWQVLSHSWGNVYVRIQYADCNKSGGICGWPVISLEHSFAQPAKIDVRLKGIDCSNETTISGFSTGGNAISANKEYKSQGNWHLFKQVQEVVRVEVSIEKDGDRYTLLVDKERNINSVLKNGRPMNANGLTDQEEKDKKAQQEKKEQELAEQKKREEEEKQKEEKAKQEEAEAARIATQKREEEERQAQHYEDSVKRKRYADSLQAIEEDRTNRLQQMQAADNTEKVVVAGVTAGVAALALSGTDNHKSDKTVRLKVDAALSYDQLPAFSNTTGRDPAYKWSRYDALGYIGGNLGLHVGFKPSKGFELYIKPFITYGVQLGEGVSGTYMEYGGLGGLALGNKFKIGGEVQYGERLGDYTYDGDAATASLGIYTNDQIITTASVEHNYLRYEGYLLLETSEENDSYIRAGAGIEQPSYSEEQILFYKARLVFGKIFAEGLYSPAYPLDGKANYSLDSKTDKALFSIKLGVVFNL